jgi:hypothetical protein
MMELPESGPVPSHRGAGASSLVLCAEQQKVTSGLDMMLTAFPDIRRSRAEQKQRFGAINREVARGPETSLADPATERN